MFYFAVGIVLVLLLHWVLRYVSSLETEKKARLKQWAWKGIVLSFFFILARYAPWVWIFVRPYAARAYGKPNFRKPGDVTEETALALLGLKKGASPEAIKQAYREKMRQVHPDRGGSVEEASRLNQARDYLLKKGT